MWTSALSYFLFYCLHLHLNERKSERASEEIIAKCFVAL